MDYTFSCAVCMPNSVVSIYQWIGRGRVPRAHCRNCSRLSEELAAVIRTAIEGTVDPTRKC